MKSLSQSSTRSFELDLSNPVHAALCLAMTPGLGPRTFRLLTEALGSPQQVLESAPSVLREIPGIGQKLSHAVATRCSNAQVHEELQRCDKHKIDLLALSDPGYPPRLREIYDAPGVVYLRGHLLPQDDLAIAIVGTRHATRYGIRQAERLASGLAMAGFTIVSGLARGIDAAAHRGALAAGGRTLAVLGSGLLNIYPPEHAELSHQIADSGAVLSEYPTLQAPKSGAFPQRNRIVTGLSLGVIVVEAAERSGALISARLAGEQNRDVFAVPGQIDNRVTGGCHQLIRDGATLVRSVDDVIEQLGPLACPAADQNENKILHPAELQLNEQETLVLQAVESIPTGIDAILQATGLPVQRILATLSVLEIRHLVRRVSGTEYCR
ncbi:MAG: DNA-processing protein DprA [Pirellulaceae bacterium]|nr:DNA-processing protein DprA [Pirellulaceae bacterium]